MVVKMLKRRLKVNKNMDYLFLRRHRRTATSNRQKSLLLKAAERPSGNYSSPIRELKGERWIVPYINVYCITLK